MYRRSGRQVERNPAKRRSFFGKKWHGLTVFAFPPAHQRRLRTSNALERINLELKRRIRVASLFPNEASLLRLISALLGEINEEWLTAKIYLNMKSTFIPLGLGSCGWVNR